MLKNTKGLRAEDERKLKDLIEKNKNLFKELSVRYTLKDDLVEVTNRSYGAKKIIQAEVDDLKSEIEQTVSQKDKLIKELEQLSQLNNELERFKRIAEQYYPNQDTLIIDYLEDFLREDKINELENLKKKIVDFYNDIYEKGEYETSINQQISDFLLEMNNAQKFLTDTIDFKGVPVAKKDVIKKQYEEIHEYYEDLFDNNKEESIAEELNKKIEDLERFHQKIFGDDKNTSLKDDLEARLKELKNVEEEAKKVINLASDAGLAGGFVEKAKEAKTNKIYAAVILTISLVLIVGFNFRTIEFERLDEITLVSILVRVIINTPLLWLAVVANINLNKYSRLEQDYAHKEALAKSYERYKTEISKLPNLDNEAESLKYELIKINLEAFKLNPADNMDGAKSDTVVEKFLNTNHPKQENKSRNESEVEKNDD